MSKSVFNLKATRNILTWDGISLSEFVLKGSGTEAVRIKIVINTQ